MLDSSRTKILVIGNSHAACLKRAHELISVNYSISFAVMSGGTGPYFCVDEEKKLSVLHEYGEEPYYTPDDAACLPLDSYDVIVFSALGRVFGGIGAREPVIESCQVEEFGLKALSKDGNLVSKACFKDCLVDWLNDLPITHLVKQVAALSDNIIYIQPYPYFSDEVLHHPEFILSKMYQRPAEIYSCIQNTKNEWLRDLCGQVGAELIEYPRDATVGQFVKSNFVKSKDLIHPTDHYGRLVLQDLEGLKNKK